jgi:hypothetical protein
MPPVVTRNAVIVCSHGGRVTLVPRQSQVLIEGAEILCEPDLVQAPIIGCTQPASASTKPCTLVVSIAPGSSSPKVAVGGRPAYLATLKGITDGVPSGTVNVSDPGQTVVHA